MDLLLVVMSTGCGSLMQRTANLEDDELYLERGEEFITDAEYLAYAYEQAGYDAAAGEMNAPNARGGDAFQSSFGYVPQSLRGRSMLRGYMTPYGAAGFGPNPYDPWGSSFYGGYSAYNPGFYDPYNPYGSPMGGGGFGYNSWGVNPYMGNSWGNGWGMNPYAYNPYGYGYNPYNPYGVGGMYGGVNTWGNPWGATSLKSTTWWWRHAPPFGLRRPSTPTVAGADSSPTKWRKKVASPPLNRRRP